MYLDVLPEIHFTRKSFGTAIREHPILARALSFTAKYKLANEMLFYTPAPELKGIDNQYNLEQRMALICGYTETYPGFLNEDIDISAEARSIAENNRKYIFSNIDSDYTNSVIRSSDVLLKTSEDDIQYVPINTAGSTPYSQFDEDGYALD
jgi:hypothetical protein